ncbi:hypothetical protein DL766_001250 [Monosporascus sp. MC13-8B]|uniref:F-box domain-containing protein n=1 Tax=Monosporascus cannonballus TaxID=155416 RepID=A0ABY0H9X5_9PEZI|nr:hypothetical protein DL762_003691 [Monosporascus cannonballus]RYO96962.1 hypothetical protein DL763_002999 [Monosporascus cannonballus]RYP37953.1 hypothetical protein DL766_001250 [Monosporascus sp. MC13-8B]
MDTPADRRHLSNLELWLEAMDWSALEGLELRDGVEDYFVDLAPPHLVGLKHLAVEESWKQNKKQIYNPSAPYFSARLEVLERHCDSLKRIELYSRMPSTVNALSKELLDMLAERCQRLEHVSVVLDRNGSWPWEHLAALSRNPDLISADIWFELSSDCVRGATKSKPLPCDMGNIYREPPLIAFHAKEMFNFVQEQRKKETLAPLRSMVFYDGDWRLPWPGPIYDPTWFEDGTPKELDDELCARADVEWVDDDDYSGDGLNSSDSDGDFRATGFMEL